MEEPANLAMNGDRGFGAAVRRPPRIQVKSQNPISNPNPSDPRISRAPSAAMMGNSSTSHAPSPMGNYAASRAPSPVPMGNHSMPPPASSAIRNYGSPTKMGNHTTSRAPSPMGNHATARAPSPAPMEGNAPSKNLLRAPSPHPTSPERLRGGFGGGPANRAASPDSPKPPSRPRTPKSPVRSPKTPSFVPPDVIMPVFPASPEDMVGALTSMDTGLTYPYNIWGPVTKYGYLDDVAPTWAQKHHFGGKHDKLSKNRLQRRRFCFVRHPAYKELIEPEEKTCASYLDPKRKEFWRTDVDKVLKREMKEKKDRYKRLLEYLGNEEAFRKSELQRDRDNRWQAFLDYDTNVKYYPGFRNNQSGVKYDIITLRPTDPYEEKRVKFQAMKDNYMLIKRGLYIQERMSGARPYDILSWRIMPPVRTLPEWPEDIGPPPASRNPAPKIALNASKGPCSFALPFGPFGTYASGVK